MSGKRKDNKGRILRTGESQTKEGRYVYKFIVNGKQKFLYSWKLERYDRVPRGKRDDLSLREKIQALDRDRLDGIDHSGANMTVLDLYKKHIALTPQVKPSTQRGRERREKMLENDPLGSCRISSVKQSDAKAWALRQQANGSAYSTIRTDKQALKAAFGAALQDDLIRKNPFDFKLPSVIKKDDDTKTKDKTNDDTKNKTHLNAEQETSLLDFLRTDRVYRKYLDEVLILLGTGLRISELCGLTESDIDLDSGIINIDYQLLKDCSTGAYVADPKSQSGKRKVFMGPEVREAFQRVLSRPRPEHPAKIDGYGGFLFLNENGTPRTASNYQTVFRRLRAKHTKLHGPVLPENLTPHTLRHTFCTRMANGGMNPKCLQYIMGHSSIALTMNYYSHADPSAAIDNMKRVLNGPASTTFSTTFQGQDMP